MKWYFFGLILGYKNLKKVGKMLEVAGAEILQVLKINMLFLRARKNT